MVGGGDDGEDAVITGAMVADNAAAGGPATPAKRMFRGGRRRRRTPGGRPHQVSVRLTAAEFEAVSLRAAAARVSVPHYLALRALEAAPTTAMDTPALRAWALEMFNLRAELNKVGVNVNQVARLLNGGGGVGRHADEALTATTQVMRALDPAVERWMRATGAEAR